MHCHRSDWRASLLGAALMAAALISTTVAHAQGAKKADDDPPLPSKKAAPAKEPRVQVTAASAEVQSGDQVIATVRKGDLLPYSKKTDEYYLVLVDGKKGWIRRDAVREVEATAALPAVIDEATARRVKQATAYVRVRLAGGATVEGSGFFAVQRGLVLTNAHVLGMLGPGSAMPREVQVVVHSGEAEEFTLPADVLAVDRDNDLGVLRVGGRASRLPAPLTVEASMGLALVQKVYIFGFPFGTSLGKDITASESSISSIRKDALGNPTRIQVNGGMHRGNSGGPVVDTRGVVVGVAVATILGTQINFAVPGERVQELLAGRVAHTRFGEAFLDGEQAKVPVRVQCVDPLGRIAKVRLDVWTGKTGPARPSASAEPKALPGDGTPQSFTVAYQDGAVLFDLAIPPLEAGQVVWVRPILTDADGGTYWATAASYRRSSLAPLERNPVLLEQNFDRPGPRTIKLTSTYTAHMSRGAKQNLLRDAMEAEALETSRKEARGGRLDLTLGTYKFTTVQMDGKPQPLFPQAQAFLRNRTLTFIADDHGALIERSAPVLNAPQPLVLRQDFAELVHQIANCYEMTCLAVPNRKVAPQESWPTRVALLFTTQEKSEIVDLILTCTYEGTRANGGEPYAVISLTGYLKARSPERAHIAGSVTGKVHFALDDGYLSLASIKVESEGTGGDSSVARTLEITFTRRRGNTTGIAAGPVPPVAAPPPVDADYEKAVPHLRRREFDQAIALLEKAIAANPNLAKAHADLGFAYSETRQFDKAIPVLKKTVALTPNNSMAHSNLGAAYNGKRLFDDAIPCFQRAIELDPKNAFAHNNLGFAYNGKRLFDQAIPCLEKAIELNPDSAAAHNNLGAANSGKRLYDRALACFKRSIALDPKHSGAYHGMGLAYDAKGLYEDSVRCYRKVTELSPKYAPAHNNVGIAYNEMGRYDDGIPWLKKAVALGSDSAVLHDNLAAALIAVGELEAARDSLKRVVELLPKTAPQFLAKTRSLKDVETLLRLERELPDIGQGRRVAASYDEALRLGRLCRLKQHYRAAMVYYEQAFAKDPDAAKKISPTNLVIHARVAVLASAGKGIDPPPEADRPAYRTKALTALRQLVGVQQAALAKDRAANRYAVERALRALLLHRDLASVRAPALANLPASERKEWEGFWNDVEILLERAETADPSA
jgi:tetratricopeptide (TPR) repeat protein/S1-C subfamily serine protease